jgi:hypothetical protein
VTPATRGREVTWQRVALVAAAAAVFGAIGCSVAARWVAPEAPSSRDAGILLSEESTATLYHRLRPTGIPDIPVRKHLRPCCAFGYDLRARLAFLPILGYRLVNLKTIDEIGRHHYDSGVVTLGSEDSFVDEEHNGLVFTCRGGFIDTAHVRDYADWTIYLASRFFEQLASGTTIDLPNEAGKRRVVLEKVDPEFLRRHDPVSLTMAIAQWLAFQLSIWHEIATWYGWSAVPGYPEKLSAFSPEDLYSNALGTKIAVASAFGFSARSEDLYDRSVDAWLRAAVDVLGPTSLETAIEAMRSLEGVWWNPAARLPDPDLVLRRNLSIGETITPWLVPQGRASEALEAALRRECGGWPSPLPLATPSTFEGTPLRTLARLELRVDPAMASQPPFDALGPAVTQEDFPAIVAAIREQNRREFGPRADQPD